MLKYILATLLALFVTGCTWCEPKPLPPEVVTNTVYVKVPVKCNIPEINCDFTGKGFKPTEKLLECLVLQKRALELCNNKIKDSNTTRP